MSIKNIKRSDLSLFTSKQPRTDAALFLMEQHDNLTSIWEPISNGYALLDSFDTLEEPADALHSPNA